MRPLKEIEKELSEEWDAFCNKARAKIQAEIEKLQAELTWKPGDRVACLGVIKGQERCNRTHSVQFDNTKIVNLVQASAFIPADDLIPRAEHEKAVKEAKELSFLPALDRVVKAIAEGEVSEFPTRKINGIDCRLTVERVKEKTPEMPDFVCGKTGDNPAETPDNSEGGGDDPVGWVNFWYGGSISKIFKTKREAEDNAEDNAGLREYEKEVAVPLYRRPQAAPDIKMHIDNWGPGIAGKVVLAMDGGKVVASMALSDLLESCSPPDAGLGAGRDPEKLEELLEAVKYAKHELARHMSTREGEESEADLLKAYRELDGKLAAFEGGSHE